MKTIEGKLYDFPAYYDLLFGFDWKAETEFLQAVFAKHGPRRIGRALEPACGTGRLLFRLGKQRLLADGFDLNEKAVAYCNRRMERHGLAGRAWPADMTNFQVAKPYDVAFNLMNSFRHVTSPRGAAGHLRCVADALVRGGLYVLGLHLTPTSGEPMDFESWSARRGQLAVTSRLKTRLLDRTKRVEEFDFDIDVHTPKESFRIHDEMTFRTYTRRQFDKLLAAAPSLEVVETYDFGYDATEPIEVDASTEDVVYVLRKK